MCTQFVLYDLSFNAGKLSDAVSAHGGMHTSMSVRFSAETLRTAPKVHVSDKGIRGGLLFQSDRADSECCRIYTRGWPFPGSGGPFAGFRGAVFHSPFSRCSHVDLGDLGGSSIYPDTIMFRRVCPDLILVPVR